MAVRRCASVCVPPPSVASPRRISSASFDPQTVAWPGLAWRGGLGVLCLSRSHSFDPSKFAQVSSCSHFNTALQLPGPHRCSVVHTAQMKCIAAGKHLLPESLALIASSISILHHLIKYLLKVFSFCSLSKAICSMTFHQGE